MPHRSRLRRRSARLQVAQMTGRREPGCRGLRPPRPMTETKEWIRTQTRRLPQQSLSLVLGGPSCLTVQWTTAPDIHSPGRCLRRERFEQAAIALDRLVHMEALLDFPDARGDRLHDRHAQLAFEWRNQGKGLKR